MLRVENEALHVVVCSWTGCLSTMYTHNEHSYKASLFREDEVTDLHRVVPLNLILGF